MIGCCLNRGATVVFFSRYSKKWKLALWSHNRCFMLYQMANYAAGKDGDIAEVGIYKGGTAKIISKLVLKNRSYF